MPAPVWQRASKLSGARLRSHKNQSVNTNVQAPNTQKPYRRTECAERTALWPRCMRGIRALVADGNNVITLIDSIKLITPIQTPVYAFAYCVYCALLYLHASVYVKV